MGFSSWLFNLTEGVGIAFDAIRANKVRAALTILGVAVGVFVVVTLSEAVHGINASGKGSRVRRTDELLHVSAPGESQHDLRRNRRYMSMETQSANHPD